ncbi:MAG: flagellar biosynthetic protein FliR [Candidatus Gastranaerophilales bacterium]|nr:flagellar biosynthetic protein FliR [Candidatus Gastranaerophilales bacterium]
METFLAFFKHFPEFNNALVAGLLIFARFMGFIRFAPVISRKEVPTIVKLAFALIMSIIFVGILKIEPMPADFPYALGLLINGVLGAFMGFVASAIFAAVSAGGDMINMQMGLSSATMFDQSTRSQSSLLGSYFNLLAAVIYVNIGGIYWLIMAFEKSFELCGIFAVSFNMVQFASPDYLVAITANVLYVGLQIAAPILLASLGQDIILGIISRTAPQVNVFQLSFLFKPVLGAMILIFILPTLLNVIQDYFASYQNIINF